MLPAIAPPSSSSSALPAITPPGRSASGVLLGKLSSQQGQPHRVTSGARARPSRQTGLHYNPSRASPARCHDASPQADEILVCTSTTCRKDGALNTFQHLKDLAPPRVQVHATGCLGNCGMGPNCILLPAKLDLHHCNTVSHVAHLLALQCGASPVSVNLEALRIKNEGNMAFDRGDFPAAEQLYTTAMALGPPGGLHLLLCNRSAARLKQGRLVGALRDAEEALSLAPWFATSVMRQAEVHVKSGDLAAAEAAYNKAAEIDPSLLRKTRTKINELRSRTVTADVRTGS